LKSKRKIKFLIKYSRRGKLENIDVDVKKFIFETIYAGYV